MATDAVHPQSLPRTRPTHDRTRERIFFALMTLLAVASLKLPH